MERRISKERYQRIKYEKEIMIWKKLYGRKDMEGMIWKEG